MIWVALGVLVAVKLVADWVESGFSEDQRQRYTHEILRVLDESIDPLPGLEISRRSKVGASRLYPALQQLEDSGQIVSDWEPGIGDVPRRRLYWVNR